jgi:predicted Fe-Mo cluster-binding NifX family protein
MKIAVCSKYSGKNSLLANRFARAEYFIIFNTDTNEYKSIKNEAINATGGASAHAVRNLGNLGVTVVLCPEAGPKAIEALNAFEIEAYNFSASTTVRESIELFNQGILPLITTPHTKQYKL